MLNFSKTNRDTHNNHLVFCLFTVRQKFVNRDLKNSLSRLNESYTVFQTFTNAK